MSTFEHLKIAADNVLRAVSDIRIEASNIRAQIEKTKHDAVARESELTHDMQGRLASSLNPSTLPQERVVLRAQSMHAKKEIDHLKQETAKTISDLTAQANALEAKVNGLESKASDLRNQAG